MINNNTDIQNKNNLEKCTEKEWYTIKELCESNNFNNGKECFIYDDILIVLSLVDNMTILRIRKKKSDLLTLVGATCGILKIIMEDLPNNINILRMDIDTDSNYFDYKNIFSNLPYSLNKIIFSYTSDKTLNNDINTNINQISQKCWFNLLFNIKIPFNCNLFIDVNYTIYPVLSSNDAYSLIIKTEKGPFIIKYRDEFPIYLTGNPTITFFRYVYRPYTTFKSESFVNLYPNDLSIESEYYKNKLKKQKYKDNKFLQKQQNKNNKYLFNTNKKNILNKY